jgi:hypothetical protein
MKIMHQEIKVIMASLAYLALQNPPDFKASHMHQWVPLQVSKFIPKQLSVGGSVGGSAGGSVGSSCSIGEAEVGDAIPVKVVQSPRSTLKLRMRLEAPSSV